MVGDLTYAVNADMHYMCGCANGNGRAALLMYHPQFLDHRMPDHIIFHLFIVNVRHVRSTSPDMMLVNEMLYAILTLKKAS
ncbi:hypothetical protein TNCV_1595961 [Trichonephila clavipes]|nr:hypothetical protein TNCV_1595961 [Trichonephila clavipes]